MAEINVPGISTGRAVEVLGDTYISAIRKGCACKEIRPVILWGPTGVGKSESIHQIAARIMKETGKQVEIRDIRLSNCALTDLVGIPTADREHRETIWLKPEIFHCDEKDKDNIILMFFDELDKAAPSVQAAALQLILDRKSWTHRLPENAYILAAANPARDTGTYSTRMKPELLNRFRHYNIQPEFESFREWGIENRIHPYVLGYLSYDYSKLYADEEGRSTAFPTPRSWKSVSDTLILHADRTVDDLYIEICSDIGMAAALEFRTWSMVFQDLPVTGNIFRGVENRYPQGPDGLHALIASMTTYVSEHREMILPEELQNACSYVSRFPVDYATLFYRNLVAIEDMKIKLMKAPDFLAWINKHSGVL